MILTYPGANVTQKNSIVDIKNDILRLDAVFLPVLAKAGLLGHIDFVDSVEIFVEASGLPRMASASGRFFGCPVKRIKLPVDSPRVWLGNGRSADEWTDRFLASISHPRIIELCKVTGAYQGNNRPLHRNQARDALHIWTAEEAHADAFLTMDYKLAKAAKKDPKKRVSIKICSPREALKDLLYSLGAIRGTIFLAKSFRFAKRHVKFDEKDGWN